MSNLAQRFITGAIGVALVVGAILYGEITFLLLLLGIVVLGLIEFYRLCNQDGIQAQKILGLLISILVFIPPILSGIIGATWNTLPLLILLPYFIFIREVYTKSVKPFTNIAYTLLGIIYITVPLFLFYLISFQGLHKGNYNHQNILGYLIILWCYDSGAYFAGTYLGKHKLFERLSPKKTWEGVVGGVILGLLATFIVAHYYSNFDLTVWMIIAAIIFATGTFGDLVESLFKRSLQTKDSGTLLPGHGGILDRFAALFISAPFVFFYLEYFQ